MSGKYPQDSGTHSGNVWGICAGLREQFPEHPGVMRRTPRNISERHLGPSSMAQAPNIELRALSMAQAPNTELGALSMAQASNIELGALSMAQAPNIKLGALSMAQAPNIELGALWPKLRT